MHAVLLLCPALDGQHMPLSMAYHPPLCTQEDKALLSYKKNPSIVHQLVAGLAGKKKKKSSHMLSKYLFCYVLLKTKISGLLVHFHTFSQHHGFMSSLSWLH